MLADSVNCTVYTRAVKIATIIDVQPSKPRTSGRQANRSNAVACNMQSSDAIANHYRVNMFIPFVDHVIQYLEDRFPQQLKPMLMAWYPISINTICLSDDIIKSLQEEFDSDLPSSSALHQEIDRWKNYCKHMKTSNVATLADALSVATPLMFPNISTILQLVLLPVGAL